MLRASLQPAARVANAMTGGEPRRPVDLVSAAKGASYIVPLGLWQSACPHLVPRNLRRFQPSEYIGLLRFGLPSGDPGRLPSRPTPCQWRSKMSHCGRPVIAASSDTLPHGAVLWGVEKSGAGTFLGDTLLQATPRSLTIMGPMLAPACAGRWSWLYRPLLCSKWWWLQTATCTMRPSTMAIDPTHHPADDGSYSGRRSPTRDCTELLPMYRIAMFVLKSLRYSETGRMLWEVRTCPTPGTVDGWTHWRLGKSTQN